MNRYIDTFVMAGMPALLFAACNQGQAPEPVERRQAEIQTQVEPEVIDGNPTCEDVFPGEGYFELKIEGDVPNGTFTDGTLVVTISGSTGLMFDFESNRTVDAVLVKGGPNANLYDYRMLGGTTADTGLSAPDGAGLSHASFCYRLVPAVEVMKDGDDLSKIGDDVTYHFTITNTGDFDLTLLSVIDDVLGDLSAAADAAGCTTLALGASCWFSYPWTVPDTATDPTVNTVTVEYDSAGGQATDSASHTLNLFQPSMMFTKVGDPFSKVGDTINYTLTLTNTSSSDSPSLVCSIVDMLIGVDESVTLASGELHVIERPYIVQEGDPDPFTNTATVSCSPLGFPNMLMATASATTDLLQPAWTLTKECINSPVPQGQPARFRVTLTNTGTADLVVQLNDPAMPAIDGTYAVAVDAALVLEGEIAVPAGAAYVDNTVNAIITLDPSYGLANEYTDSAQARCNVAQMSFEGCTPGGWRNPNGRLQLWDEPTDPLAMAAGFYADTSFNSYFGLTPSHGFSDTFTMLDAINAGGGGKYKLARHAVAALLNVAAGLNYDFPPGASDLASLRDLIAQAFINFTYEPLATQLDAANNQLCTVSAP